MNLALGSHLHALSLFGSLGMALMVMVVRLRSAAKPLNIMKIIMPPIGMSTGFLMFVAPLTRIPLWWGLISFLAGAVLFSYPLIRTSRLYLEDGQVYMKRSKAFLGILFVLLIGRLALHEYVEEWITIYQTGAVFFILAFGMLLPWRVYMYVQFKKIRP
ncbi:CcdC family protein [Paenibacillus hexagrammi]|uniref:Cytochrome c biogenesis protein CcdC n=1 Tax=Paenibacillus hexagrammi TaxID=2908839 RepID=A0ABY3SQ11_9BACL|nr:cytochrome c biogenesis protein CcdC [Paenibacillus sp. YPD9-1]UJF35215.1 cytochrome c biogenesis protein CcdC [Paenibacillus sp. YPD9-1]